MADGAAESGGSWQRTGMDKAVVGSVFFLKIIICFPLIFLNLNFHFLCKCDRILFDNILERKKKL